MYYNLMKNSVDRIKGINNFTRTEFNIDKGSAKDGIYSVQCWCTFEQTREIKKCEEKSMKKAKPTSTPIKLGLFHGKT